MLVIEDEPHLVESLQHNLRRERYAVRAATTGAAGLDEAQIEPRPDLILLDLNLPDMSGLDVCGRLRKDPRTSAVPVVMLTARGAEVDRVVGFEAGADD